MMNKLLTTSIGSSGFLLTAFLLVSCAQPVQYDLPANGVPAVQSPVGQNGQAAVLNAQATLQADQYWSQATAEAARATEQFEVQQQVAAATGTAVMVAQIATRDASAAATGTAVAVVAQATSQAEMAIRATDSAMAIIQMTAEAQQADDTIRRELEMVEIQNRQEELAQQRQAEALRLERQRMWNTAIQYGIGIATFLFLCLCGLGFYWLYEFIRTKYTDPTVVMDATQPLLVREGYTMFLPHQALPRSNTAGLLEAPTGDVTATTSTVNRLPTPKWHSLEQFVTRGTGRTVLVGVGANGRPVLVDRTKQPHLAIAGSTGAGKSVLTQNIAVGFLSAGVHVLMVNTRGSDFAPLRDQRNVTFSPSFRNKEQAPFQLQKILQAITADIRIRDRILQESGYKNWAELPEHLRHSGEVLVVIDEFLTIVKNAQRIIRDPRTEKDEKEMYVGAIMDMWIALGEISDEARKFGVYIILTMTDPTGKALGDEGMMVRSQMGRIAMRMNDAAASRVFLGLQSGSDFSNGSVGLPQGEFLMYSGGSLRHGASYYPDDDMTRTLVQSLQLRPNRLPEEVATALNITHVNRPQPKPNVTKIVQAEIDGRTLEHMARQGSVFSLNKIALELEDWNDTGRATGEGYRKAADALRWRIANLQCSWAIEVVGRSSSKHITPIKEEFFQTSSNVSAD